MNDCLWAIVPAAGMGVRAGQGIPKQFAPVGGRPVLELTLSRLLDIPEVDGVVVPLPPGFHGYGGFLGSMGSPKRPVITLTGGATRHESVRLALREVPQDASWVAVHDAARPFVTKDLLYRVWTAAREHGAAICGVRLSDTVKKVRDGAGAEPACFVEATLDRDALVNVQTPQVFMAGLLKEAHREAEAKGWPCTDDSQLVETLGHPVAVVQGECTNLKITNPEDFDLAEAILARQGQVRGTHTVTGFGFDVHPLERGRKCVLGGVDIPSDTGLLGHSDADVLLHAIMDGILGALTKGDIGVWFPPGDPKYKDVSSLELMGNLWQLLRGEARVLHVDATVVAEAPKVSPYYSEIRGNIARALEMEPDRVSIKATTAERLGALGRQEGIAAFAVVTLARHDSKYRFGGTYSERCDS